jgi:hypothetical protein
MPCFLRIARIAVLLVTALVLAASILACARRETSLPALAGFENVKGPVRIARAGVFMDGGTCSAELLDAKGQRFYIGFDGRMQMGDGLWPYHCFIGAEHPRRMGARMLPLWGPEERAMIAIANAAIDATLIPGQRATVLRTASRGTPKGVDWGVAAFVIRVQGRMETLEALDQGELDGLGATLTYFNARAPLAADRIIARPGAAGFDITIADRDGKSWRISIPSSSDSASAVVGASYRLKSRNGSHQERMLLTLLSHALKNPTASPDTAHLALVRQIDQRKARILADDRSR